MVFLFSFRGFFFGAGKIIPVTDLYALRRPVRFFSVDRGEANFIDSQSLLEGKAPRY